MSSMITILVLCAVVAVISLIYFNSVQTAIDKPVAGACPSGTVLVGTTCQSVSQTPSTVSLKIRAIDKETANVQVATTLFAWRTDDTTHMLSNGQTTSATAGTDTAVNGIVVGKTIAYVAFDNATYVGGKLSGDKGTLSFQEATIAEESPAPLEAETHALITGGISVKIYDASTETTIGSQCDNSPVNITLSSADQVEVIDWLEIEINATQKSIYFDSIVFDTPADSNIASITVDGMTDISGQKIMFLKDKQNYRFAPSAPIFLHDFQTFKTGNIQVKASADVTTEDVDVYFIDRQEYKAVNTKDGHKAGEIVWGVENDKDTPEDIGHHYLNACAQFSVN